MPIITQRICIYTKDIQRITGRSERYARHLLDAIRQVYGKPPGGLVTIEEFCHYTKIREEEIKKFL